MESPTIKIRNLSSPRNSSAHMRIGAKNRRSHKRAGYKGRTQDGRLNTREATTVEGRVCQLVYGASTFPSGGRRAGKRRSRCCGAQLLEPPTSAKESTQTHTPRNRRAAVRAKQKETPTHRSRSAMDASDGWAKRRRQEGGVRSGGSAPRARNVKVNVGAGDLCCIDQQTKDNPPACLGLPAISLLVHAAELVGVWNAVFPSAALLCSRCALRNHGLSLRVARSMVGVAREDVLV